MLVDVQAPVCYNFGFSRTQMTANSTPPPNLIGNINVRASSYTALVRVSMRGVGLRCVGLAKGFLHAATRVPVFSPFSLFAFYSLPCIITYVCFFHSLSAFPQNPCYL